VGTLSGSNYFSVSLADWDLASLALSDVLSVSWRYGRLGFTSTTAFSAQGLASQDFRATIPLDGTLVQGAAYFTEDLFSRGSLTTSWALGEIPFTVSLLGANLGSHQTPDYGFGATLRLSGGIPDLLRWMIQAGIGATPAGQVQTGSCFEGVRLSVSDIPLCGGAVSADILVGQSGPTGEYVSWQVPLPVGGFKLRVSLSYKDLFEREGLAASVAGTIGELNVYGNFSFDETWAFTHGGWQASGPLFDGDLVSSVTIDPDGIVGLAISYSFSLRDATISLQPEIVLDTTTCFSTGIEIPSLRVDIRYPVTCCGGVNLGDVSLSLVTSKAGVDSLSFSYAYRF